jgi:hypothetical protein
MDAMQELKLRMQLMEGKEFRFGCNNPGNDKKELVKKTIESLQQYLKNMEDHPEDYTETDPDPWFTLSVELFKVKKPLGL